MQNLIIFDTGSLLPTQGRFGQEQLGRDYRGYLSQDRVVESGRILDRDPISVKWDEHQESFVCLDGHFRASLATVYGVGASALQYESMEECPNRTVARNFLYAHGTSRRLRIEGVTMQTLVDVINKSWLPEDMREKYGV